VRGGAGNGSTDLVKSDGRKLPAPSADGESGISTEISVVHAGKKFKVAAYGLWGAGTAVLATMLATLKWAPEAQQLMWLLSFIAGSFLATGAMNGRLADNRAELARVRAELDRKSAENSKLVTRIVKNPQSSRQRRRKEER
jgi:hypothetical protein